MVRPKRWEASANLLTMIWRSDSVCALRARSSANSASRTIFFTVFVLAVSRRMSNRKPSSRYRRYTLCSRSLMAWFSKQAKNRLKRSQHTPLLDAVRDVEGLWCFTDWKYMSCHVVTGLANQLHGLGRAPQLEQNHPKGLTADRVEGFRQLYEDSIEVHIIFDALLLHLAYREDHVDAAAVWTESTLSFRQVFLRDVVDEEVEDDPSQDLPSDGQERHASVVAAVSLTAPVFWMWHSWILWAHSLLPKCWWGVSGVLWGPLDRLTWRSLQEFRPSRGISRAGLSDRLRNFIDRWGEVEAGGHGLLWDLVEHSGVHSGGSAEQGTEVFPPPCVDAALLLKQGWVVSWQERRGSWLGRGVDFLDEAEEHFLVLCGCVGFDFVCLLPPPLVLHSAKYRLGLPLAVLEAEEMSFCHLMKAFFLSSRSYLMCSSFSSNQSWWTFFFGPLVSLADSVTRVLNCSHCWGGGPDSGPKAVSLSSRSFANTRLCSSCFSFAASKAGLQDFAVLRHVGVMCSDNIDLRRRWSVQHSALPPPPPPPPSLCHGVLVRLSSCCSRYWSLPAGWACRWGTSFKRALSSS